MRSPKSFSNKALFNLPDSPNLSYQQLADQICLLTQQLRVSGIKKTDRVAVALPNGMAMAVVFTGVTAGVVCAPLNPNYRQVEFAFYLEDLKAKALILPKESDSPALAAAQTLGIPILTVNLQADPGRRLFSLQGDFP
ncbi:MAG: AMP-binding protein [Synechocystis sp.]